MVNEVAGLDDLAGLAFVFVIVLARVGSTAMLLPGIGEVEVPSMIRAGFALAHWFAFPVFQKLVRTFSFRFWPVNESRTLKATIVMVGRSWSKTRASLLRLPRAGGDPDL